MSLWKRKASRATEEKAETRRQQAQYWASMLEKAQEIVVEKHPNRSSRAAYERIVLARRLYNDSLAQVSQLMDAWKTAEAGSDSEMDGLAGLLDSITHHELRASGYKAIWDQNQSVSVAELQSPAKRAGQAAL